MRAEWLFYSKNKTEKAQALPPSEENTLTHPLQRFQSGILYLTNVGNRPDRSV